MTPQPLGRIARIGSEPSPRQSIIELLSDFTTETTPAAAARIADYRAHLKPGATVFITFLPGSKFEDTVAVAIRLRGEGFKPCPPRRGPERAEPCISRREPGPPRRGGGRRPGDAHRRRAQSAAGRVLRHHAAPRHRAVRQARNRANRHCRTPRGQPRHPRRPNPHRARVEERVPPSAPAPPCTSSPSSASRPLR